MVPHVMSDPAPVAPKGAGRHWVHLGESRHQEGRNCCTTAAGERSERWERHSPAASKVREGGGEEVLHQHDCINDLEIKAFLPMK